MGRPLASGALLAKIGNEKFWKLVDCLEEHVKEGYPPTLFSATLTHGRWYRPKATPFSNPEKNQTNNNNNNRMWGGPEKGRFRVRSQA